MEIANPYAAEQQAFRDDVTLLFTERGFDAPSIELGIECGLAWLQYTCESAAQLQEANANPTGIEVGEIMSNAKTRAYQEYEPQMRERGIIFPGPGNIPFLTLAKVIHETFIFAHGPAPEDAEAAERLLTLMYQYEQQRTRTAR